MRRISSYTNGVNLSSAALSPCRHSISSPVRSSPARPSVVSVVIVRDSNIGCPADFSLSLTHSHRNSTKLNLSNIDEQFHPDFSLACFPGEHLPCDFSLT